MLLDVEFATVDLEFVQPLGRGAFGEVFLVHARRKSENGIFSSENANRFALKRTSLGHISEAAVDQALAEGKLLKQLGEECNTILRCFDFRIVQGTAPIFDLLLEFAPLGDLNRRLTSCKRHSGSQDSSGLPEFEVVSYACDLAKALKHIHSLRPKVLHRDVKPANVVLFYPPADGSRRGVALAKLADFGIAKILETEGSFDGTATVIGTPHYLSPEICRGEAYDERSDIWAFGCVIYEMICLHRPFHHAEHNIAVLAMRISVGVYDKEILAQQQNCYNPLLIFTLVGLMALESNRRSCATDALESLQMLYDGMIYGADVACPWWEIIEPTVDGGCVALETLQQTMMSDGWDGAMRILLEEVLTMNPAGEVVSSITRKPVTCFDTVSHSFNERSYSANAALAEASRADVTSLPVPSTSFYAMHCLPQSTGHQDHAEWSFTELLSETQVLDIPIDRRVESGGGSLTKLAWADTDTSVHPTADVPVEEPRKSGHSGHREASSCHPKVDRGMQQPETLPTRIFMKPLWRGDRPGCVDCHRYPVIF